MALRRRRSLFRRAAAIRNVKTEQHDELSAQLGESVKFDVPLAGLSTYRIGGPAEALFEPCSAEDVSRALRTAATLEIPWMVVGLGSNILAADEGFAGLVIRMGQGLADVTRDEDDDSLWTVGAGLPTPLLAKQTAAAGLDGVHRLIGVPGTVGGGVFMNAGAHAQEFRDVVTSVDVVARDGSQSRIPGASIPWRYRSSGLDGVVVATQLSLRPGDPEDLLRDVKKYLRWRKSGTPFDRPCCGSVFRNPTAEQLTERADEVGTPLTAGRLIDAAGLKGFRVGGAEVSPMHANYIVNTGDATARDVASVIETVRERVFDRFGIDLQLEVQLLHQGSRREDS